MNASTKFERITMNPDVLLGKPTIRGTRIPVYLIVELVEAGFAPAETVDDYPCLEIGDLEAAVEFNTEVLTRGGL